MDENDLARILSDAVQHAKIKHMFSYDRIANEIFDYLQFKTDSCPQLAFAVMAGVNRRMIEILVNSEPRECEDDD